MPQPENNMPQLMSQESIRYSPELQPVSGCRINGSVPESADFILAHHPVAEIERNVDS